LAKGKEDQDHYKPLRCLLIENIIGLGIHLFVKVPRPGDSEVTFSVFESNE